MTEAAAVKSASAEVMPAAMTKVLVASL